VKKRLVRIPVVLLVCLASCTISLSAAQFDPDFTVAKITGNSQVQLSGSNDFVAAAEGQKCAYGATVKTDAGASCVLRFSEGNGCLVYEKTIISVTESDRNKKLKVLKLTEGGVEVDLEKDFHKRNQLKVETPSLVCEAIGCTFSMDYQIIGGLRTSTAGCTDGSTRLTGNYFSISDVGANDQVSVAESPDGTLIRIKINKGDVIAHGKDTDGSDRKVALSADDEMTILVQESKDDPSKLIVVYKVVFADKNKAPLLWQTVFTKPGVEAPPEPRPTQPALTPGLGYKQWPNLTVATPIIQTPTPVGRR